MKNSYRVTKLLRGNNSIYYIPEKKSLFRWKSLLPFDDPGYSSVVGAWDAIARDKVLEVEYIYPEDEE